MKRMMVHRLCAVAVIASVIGAGSSVTWATNLVLNPSFEEAGTPAANWTQENGLPGTVIQDTDHPHSGAYDLHVLLGSTADSGIKSTAFTVTEGSNYTLSFYAQGNSAGNPAFPASIYPFGPSAAMDVNVSWLDSLGNPIAGDAGLLHVATLADISTGQSSTYSKLNYGITVPSSLGVAGAKVFLHFVTGAVEGGSADISLDDVSFDDGFVSTPVTATWNIPSSGDWNTGDNWTGGVVPNSTNALATLGSTITSKQTIYSNNSVTLAGLKFANSNTYVVAGTDSLTINNTLPNGTADAGIVAVTAGSHKLSLPLNVVTDTEFNIVPSPSTLTLANAFNVTGGVVLSKTGAGTLKIQGAQSYGSGVTLNINAGSVVFDVKVGKNLTINNSGGSVSLPALANQELGALNVSAGSVALANSTPGAVTTDSLTLTGTGTVDVNNNQLIIKNGSASAIQSAIALGNLVSSESNGARTIGYLTGAEYLGSTFGGVAVAASDLLVSYAITGDSNLDGAITAQDYANIDASFGTILGTASWSQGDFNHDGQVNYLDYAAIDAGLLTSQGETALALAEIGAHTAAFGTVYESALSSAVASVPEPASVSLLLLGAAGLLARRRR